MGYPENSPFSEDFEMMVLVLVCFCSIDDGRLANGLRRMEKWVPNLAAIWVVEAQPRYRLDNTQPN